MEKLFFVLSICFAVLTFCGAGYVLFTRGAASAGYACVPMAFCVAFLAAYRSRRTHK